MKSGIPTITQAKTDSAVPTSSDDEFKPLDFDLFKEEMEKEFIIKALKSNQGRINQTVATANIPKNTLLRKIKKYGINVKEISESSKK
jgi:DNA-binding NtrC family response regulator